MVRLKMKIAKFLTVCMVVATFFSVVPMVSAAESQSSTAAISDAGQVSPRAEETVWVTRVYNGKKQIRLWSLTRGIWLTDWIDYDY